MAMRAAQQRQTAVRRATEAARAAGQARRWHHGSCEVGADRTALYTLWTWESHTPSHVAAKAAAEVAEAAMKALTLTYASGSTGGLLVAAMDEAVVALETSGVCQKYAVTQQVQATAARAAQAAPAAMPCRTLKICLQPSTLRQSHIFSAIQCGPRAAGRQRHKRRKLRQLPCQVMPEAH